MDKLAVAAKLAQQSLFSQQWTFNPALRFVCPSAPVLPPPRLMTSNCFCYFFIKRFIAHFMGIVLLVVKILFSVYSRTSLVMENAFSAFLSEMFI
jgi:hypothetical protein